MLEQLIKSKAAQLITVKLHVTANLHGDLQQDGSYLLLDSVVNR